MIQVRNLSVSAGSFRLRNIQFDVPDRGYAVLMGKTGTGKTTLLEAVCGLRSVESGRLLLAGRDVSRLTPGQRDIGYVPQDRALFSTMTVRENLEFALVLRRWKREEITDRVHALARWLGIEPLLARNPRGLSGGEAQRVALGRALAFRPSVLCLDEPLSALDEDTREEMFDLLEAVRTETGVTTLHVTHQLRDAERLADKVLVLQDGQVVEKPAP